MHSSDYRRPQDLPGGRVLVVGGGNSGYQIAEDLAADPEAGRASVRWITPDAPPATHLRPGTVRHPQSNRPHEQDRRLATRPATEGPRHADRLQQPPGKAPRHRHSKLAPSPRRHPGRLRRRQGVDGRRRRLGDRLRRRSFLDRSPGLRPRRSSGSCSRRHRIARPVLPRAARLHTRGSALLGFVKDDAAHIARTSSPPPRRSTRMSTDRATPSRSRDAENQARPMLTHEPGCDRERRGVIAGADTSPPDGSSANRASITCYRYSAGALTARARNQRVFGRS